MMELDKKFFQEEYYKRLDRQDKKRTTAVAIARKKGEAAKDWLKTNTLTPKTKPEFDKLMKSIKL